MRLHNTLSARERAQRIRASGQARLTLSFYKYHRLEDPAGFRDRLFADWSRLDVLGRIYVAPEGINAQLSLPAAHLADFTTQLETIPFLKGVRLNLAVEQDDMSFLKLKIKVRAKIVADGIEDPDFDPSRVGVHVGAKDFNAMLDRPDTLLVDMRNRYESEIGHFPGALRPDAVTFRESLESLGRELPEKAADRKLVLYCTGGIRCEKASAWFRHRGFPEVYQLEGGIIGYLRQAEEQGLENRFLGKNFVFDGRMAERISDAVVSDCHQCGAPCDTHRNCANPVCHMLFLQCPACSERMGGCCSGACREFASLPAEKQKALRKGVKAPLNYFRKPG